MFFGGTPAEAPFYAELATLEIEENLDLPGAISFDLALSRTAEGQLPYVGDPRFAPYANIAVVAQAEGKPAQCIFDGYVLSHKVHLETGVVNSHVTVWGQDSTVLMGLTETVKEWSDGSTDAVVANEVFQNYGFATAPANTDDDSPAYTEDRHTLMQRGTDIAFLRRLARRTGKICRVACNGAPGARTGFFAKPALDGEPVATLIVNDQQTANVHALDFEWDVMRPTAAEGAQALFSDTDPVTDSESDGGLAPLSATALAQFAGRDTTVRLTAPVDDAGELGMRLRSVLRDAGWFVRCTGETEIGALGDVLRAGTVVQMGGLGDTYSGKYYVWSVRHTITANSHVMKFVLVGNALGASS